MRLIRKMKSFRESKRRKSYSNRFVKPSAKGKIVKMLEKT